MPDDAAVRHTPFVNMLVGSLSAGKRFDSGIYVGLELGGFWVGRFRGTLRASFPFAVSQPTGDPLANPEFRAVASKTPVVIWGASAGYALYSSSGFALSLTANYLGTDVGDFGHMLGLGLPFEWVSRDGVRIGFETGLMRGVGGEVLGECQADSSSGGPFGNQGNPECDVGEIRAFDRDAAGGIWMHFLIGIPYERPKPVPVVPR